MKDYKQLLKELPSTTVVCALGDFDPPTVAHELLVKTVKRLAESKGSAHVIFTSPSKTLQEDKKSQYLNLMFPKTNFTSIEESFTLSVEQLKKKYRNVIVVVGAEQSTGLKKALKESVDFVTIADKNPDADTSKMKSFATKALYEEFKKKLPSSIRELDSRRLMNDVRAGMGLEPIKEQLNLVKDTLREQYFRGEIFNEGDIVESNGVQYTIVKRGSNHLLLKEESGELVSKWIQDVKSINEGALQPNGTDKIVSNGPESDTGAKQDVVPKGKTKGFLTFYNYNMKESALNVKDPHADYVEKSKALHQLSLNKDVDQAQVTQRKLDLDKEYAKHKVEEAKEKPVCPKCGKHECECGEERPGIGTDTSMSKDPFFKEEFEEMDITEEEIDQMIESVSDEDIENLYEEHEVELVYEDTGEIVEHHEDEAKIDLMEVLSRQERMKGKIRLRKTAAKRGRSTKIALKHFSNPTIINKRARRLAIKLMKKRMLRGRDPSKISVGEKERIEKALSKRKDVINRVATKLVSRVRKVEKARMSHGKVTKGAMPSVF